MNHSSDSQLLLRYAESHSEAAFTELVGRHVDFVHSAAVRMVCDPHLAEDVTQGVFVALAKNAAQLAERPAISGWLHRTAQNIAAQTVRTNVRRRVREQEAVAMNELIASSPDASWEHIAPHLDAALGELSDADRDAVLLRYFEKKSAREMAAQLGMSDEAAQKRVSRAVEKLREFFAKRGVTIGASGLAVVISVNAVQAAPVGLTLTISAAALTGTTVTTSTVITATKTIAMTTLQKTIVTATIAVLAGVGIYEARQATRLREQVQTLQQQAEQTQQLQSERDDAMSKFAALRDDNELLNRNQTDLLKLRDEIAQLRQQQVELRKSSEELFRQQEQYKTAQAAIEEVVQRFEAQRTVTGNAMKRVGVQLRALAAENKLDSAFTADGSLNPALLDESQFDLRKVELLVNSPSELEKLLKEAPETIVARTADPIPTPDGRWMYIYTLADGSVQSYSGEFPDQAFTGNLKIQILKPRP